MEHLNRPLHYTGSKIYRDGGSIGIFCRNAIGEDIQIFFRVLHGETFGRVGLQRPRLQWLNVETYDKYVSDPIDWITALEILKEINDQGTHWDYAYSWTLKVVEEQRLDENC